MPERPRVSNHRQTSSMPPISSERSDKLQPTPPRTRNGRRFDGPPRSASYPFEQGMTIPLPAGAGQRPFATPPASSASSPGLLPADHAYDYHRSIGESSQVSYPSRDWQTSQHQQGYASFDPCGTQHCVPSAFSQPETRSAAQLMPPPAALQLTPRDGSDPVASPARAERTPRPPNAWILYRSDKLRAIASGETVPGLEDASTSTSASSGDETKKSESQTPDTSSRAPSPPKGKKTSRARKALKPPTEGLLALGRGKFGRGLPQADISKLISSLWRSETPEVRAKYERLSDQKKMEHQRMFPNYKFQPMRKAEKIKMREEKEQERTAAKRERDIRNAAGQRGRGRAVRNRLRASPASPYSNPQIDVHRNFQAPPMARALTFSRDDAARKATADGVAAGTTVFWASEGNAYPPPRPLTPAPPRSYESAFTFAQPEPPASESSYTYNVDPFPFPAAATPALVGDLPGSAPRAEAGYLVVPHNALSSGDYPQHHSSESQAAVNYSGSWDGYNQALAIPYMFEPIPLPDDLVLEDAVQFEQPIDSNSLAAMWCTLEEAPGEPALSNWDVDSGEAVDQWSDFTIPPDDLDPKSFELSSTLASRIASQWLYDQEGSHNRRGMSNYASTGYLSFQVDGPSESEREGPLLSEAIPLSPADWLSPDTPGLAMADSSGSNRRVSAVDSDLGGGPIATASELGLQPSTSLPSNLGYRHVSNSAYPQYPLSLDSTHGFLSSDLPGWSLPMSSRASSLSGIPPPLSFGKANDEDALDDWNEEPQGLSPPPPTGEPGALGARRRGRVVGASFGSGTE